MKVFLNAKKAVLISLFFITIIAHAKMEIIPHLKCGEYLVRGRFVNTTAGDFIIRIRDNTTSPFEFIVLGGDVDEKLNHSEAIITAKVRVEKEIKSNNKPYVFLISFDGDQELNQNESYKLLKPGKCK